MSISLKSTNIGGAIQINGIDSLVFDTLGNAYTNGQLLGGPNGFYRVAVFTTTSSWTVPTGVTKGRATVVGAGGNSGASNGGAGGAGGAAIKLVTGLTPGGTVAVTVGTSAAGTSSFGAFCSATGGSAGVANLNGGGGAGGAGSGGDLNVTGGIGMQSLREASVGSIYRCLGGTSYFGVGSYGKGGDGGNINQAGYPGIVIFEY